MLNSSSFLLRVPLLAAPGLTSSALCLMEVFPTALSWFLHLQQPTGHTALLRAPVRGWGVGRGSVTTREGSPPPHSRAGEGLGAAEGCRQGADRLAEAD